MELPRFAIHSVHYILILFWSLESCCLVMVLEEVHFTLSPL